MPRSIRLCVVKVETSEPGLHGLGCATSTSTRGEPRSRMPGPFCRDRNADHIEDFGRALHELLLA
jgi:hypothetical protein